MRKLLLTTAFVLPLAAAPALAQDTTTDTMEAETTPMATDPAAANIAADPAAEDAAAQEAKAAEMAASGKVAQQQAANELRLDWITDATVTAPDGTAIGDINDLIVDGETGEMIAAVIGVGGFLGIGEKQIAVPWEQLSVNFDAQEINSELTEEEAEAAPEYVFRERENAPAVAPAGDMATGEADPAMAPADAETGNAVMPEETMSGEVMPEDGMPMEGGDAMDGHDATMPAEQTEQPAAEAEPAMEGGMADGEEPATTN